MFRELSANGTSLYEMGEHERWALYPPEDMLIFILLVSTIK